MPFNIGPLELILVLAIALLVIGPGKLPGVGKSIGESIREFRKATAEVQEATKLDATPVTPAAATSTAAPAPALAAPAPVAPVAAPEVAAAPPATDPAPAAGTGSDPAAQA
jgi:TatA/E family protein of Tat protein translocase